MFVKTGTMDRQSKERCRPDVHIFARSKVAWVDLGAERERGVGVWEERYDKEGVWGEESLRRWKVLGEWAAERKKAEEAREEGK